jgi:hypothetical protein
VHTFSDQLQSLADRYQINLTAAASNYHRRMAIDAINEAYNEIGRKHPWRYYIRRCRVNTRAEFTDGTIEYDSSANTLTLTGATWPSWVLDGLLVIEQNVCQPLQVIDSHSISLRPDRSPGADVAAGSQYHLFQSSYLMPSDYFSLMHIEEITRYWQIGYISPDEYHMLQVPWLMPGTPRWCTIIGSNNRNRGRYTLDLLPPPIDARTLDMLYRSTPRKRVLNQPYTTGLAATAGSTVTFTGGTILPDNIEGCVLRFGSTGVLPTGPSGESPAVFEASIQNRVDEVTLEIEQAPLSDVGPVAFSIDDPVDIDESVMLGLFEAMCAVKYARRALKDSKQLGELTAIAQDEFLKAVSASPKIEITALLNSSGPMGLRDLTFAQARRGG